MARLDIGFLFRVFRLRSRTCRKVSVASVCACSRAGRRCRVSVERWVLFEVVSCALATLTLFKVWSLSGLCAACPSLSGLPVGKVSIAGPDARCSVFISWHCYVFGLSLRMTRQNGLQFIRIVVSRRNLPDFTSARILFIDTTVCVSNSSLEVERFESWPLHPGGAGCWIFMTRRSRGWPPLLFLRSWRFLACSESDRLSRCSLFPRRSVDDSAFCAKFSSKAGYSSDHHWYSVRDICLLTPLTKRCLTNFSLYTYPHWSVLVHNRWA